MLVTLDFHFRKQADVFQLEVFSRGSSQPLAAANINFPRSFLGSFELRQLDFDSKDPAGRLDRLRRFGRRLYDQVVTRDVAQVWSEHKQRNEFLVLCVRIAPDANELESIPWETLFDGEEFLAAGTKTTISRLPLDIEPQVDVPAVALPLKMLALVSSPLDLEDEQRLQIEREQEILLEAINDPAGQGRLRVDFEDEAKLEILEGSLEAPYQIFHFTGHGMAPENGGGLLLEDGQGKSRPTSVTEVLQSLQRAETSLRLVVLSGCQTARTINVGGFRDMARGLLRRKIPAVIAMQFSISDTGGLKFAESLYIRIAAGRSLELASHAARRALLLSDDHYQKADALAPVLLTANGDCLQTMQLQAAPTVESPKIDYSFFLPLAQLSYGFYGRRREYRDVRDGILQRNQRAVIVHGIGGIGKTALVSHVATRMKKHFRGVYAFDCSSGTLTPETAMIKLHQYFQPQDVKTLEQLLYQNLSPEVLANYLAQVLSQWPLLLIFDNFESHLERTDAGFRIADENLRTFIVTLIKTTAERSHFIFTSRYLFELDDKRLGNIQSLPLEDLSRPEALNLMQKLQNLAPASYSEKLKTLETFGGHPYALVTLDRYCNHQTLAHALEDAKTIHAELREFLAIELNYAKLSERAQELLNRLAAFRQSVPTEAAEWVIGRKISYAAEFLAARHEVLPENLKLLDQSKLLRLVEDGLPERRQAEDLSGTIRELVEWGLLTPIQEDGQLKEFSIHALVRDFCRNKEPEGTWRERLRDAAAFYTNSTKLTGKEKSQATVWADMEAFELLMEADEFDDAASLLIEVFGFLDRWGFGQYLERQSRRLFGKTSESETIAILHNFGLLLRSRGEYDGALEYYDRALKLKEKLGYGVEIANSYGEIGHIHFLRSDYKQALDNYTRALKISEEFGDLLTTGLSLHHIGMIHKEQGDYARALDYLNRSLKIAEELGDRPGVGSSHNEIGSLHFGNGDYEQALEHYKRSLEINSAIENRSGIASAMHNIGVIHEQLQEYDQALEYYTRSLKISEELGYRPGISESLHQIGSVYQAQAKWDDALMYYNRSLQIEEELGNRSGLAISLLRIGQLFADLNRNDEAFRHMLAALVIFSELQSHNASVTLHRLKELRASWGEDNFRRAWTEETGEDLPDWIIN